MVLGVPAAVGARFSASYVGRGLVSSMLRCWELNAVLSC